MAASDTIEKALSNISILDPGQKRQLVDAIEDYVNAKKQEAQAEVGKNIAGYGTLPAILAVVGSMVSKESWFPILLALGGLALTSAVPELRQRVNVVNWYESLMQSQNKPKPTANP